MPAHDKALDPHDRLVGAAHAAASWARARRATWTSAPLAVETAARQALPLARSPAPEVAEPSLLSEEGDPLPLDTTPRRLTLPPGLLRWIARGAMAGALVAAASVGGPLLWDALPSLPERSPAQETRPAAAAAGKPTGALRVSSTPPGARVLVDGKPRGVTPLDIADLSPGRHEVALEGEAGSVKRTVTVQANATATIDEAIFSGFVTVYAPFDVTVTERGRVLKADDRQQIMLAPGAHELRITNRALDYDVARRVDVKPGEATTLQLTPAPSPLTVTASEAADVWLDGTRLGETPLTAAPVPLGVHEIVVRRAAGGERRFTVTIGTQPKSLAVDFTGR